MVHYFRHDTWEAVTRPFYESVISSTYEEIGEEARSGPLKEASTANLRFVPKKQGVRPIVNLKHRARIVQVSAETSLRNLSQSDANATG